MQQQVKLFLSIIFNAMSLKATTTVAILCLLMKQGTYRPQWYMLEAGKRRISVLCQPDSVSELKLPKAHEILG